MSTTREAQRPLVQVSLAPSSTAGMNCLGTAPPTTLFSNWKP